MTEYVKLENLQSFDTEFKNSLGELEQRIFDCYSEIWRSDKDESTSEKTVREQMFKEFKENFGYATGGKKYLKLVTGAFGIGRHCQTSVWGFVAKQDFKVTNKKKSGGEFINFKEGDILKAAGWNTPTLNASRGNIFTDDYKVSWTGPQYLI
tara:strand:+ start:70 stop:525 length:456 start_codon:yes stop_codon:yes gene_type:complete